MSFETLLQLNAEFMAAGPTSESIVYRAYPGFASVSKTAAVTRNPRSDLGESLAHAIDVWIDKTQLPTVGVGDEADIVVVDLLEYTIVNAEDCIGGWMIRAVR